MLEPLIEKLDELITAINKNTEAQLSGGCDAAKEESKPAAKKTTKKAAKTTKKATSKSKGKSEVTHDDIRNLVRDQRAQAKEVSTEEFQRVKDEFGEILEEVGAANISKIDDADLAEVLERAKKIEVGSADSDEEEDDDLD